LQRQLWCRSPEVRGPPRRSRGGGAGGITPLLGTPAKLGNKKLLISIRYSPEVIDYFKSSGAGWQARMDAVLREYVQSHSAADAKGA